MKKTKHSEEKIIAALKQLRPIGRLKSGRLNSESLTGLYTTGSRSTAAWR